MNDKKSIDRRLAILDPVPMQEAFGEIDDMAIETYGLFIATTEPLLAEIDRQLAAENTAAASEVRRAIEELKISGVFPQIGG